MTDPEQALRARASLYGIDSLHRNDRKRLEIMEREKQWREEREREAVAEWLEQQAKSKVRKILDTTAGWPAPLDGPRWVE
jgi:hypothetical protein